MGDRSSVQIEIDSSGVDEVCVFSSDLAHEHALVEESGILRKKINFYFTKNTRHEVEMRKDISNLMLLKRKETN